MPDDLIDAVLRAADWPSLLILGPLLAGLAAMLAPRAAAWIGLAGSLLAMVGAVRLAAALIAGGPVGVTLGGWQAPLGIVLWADGYSVLMLAMTASVGAAIAVYAAAQWGLAPAAGDSAARTRARSHFWPLWMLLLAGMNALYLSTDVFNLYVTLEIVGLAAVGLTALTGTAAALRAAIAYLIAGLLGSLLFLLGVDYLYAAYGRVDIPGISAEAAGVPGPAGRLALILMLTGLALKAALFPLQFWMPAAHAGAAPPASALLSALVVKAALYLAIRLWLAMMPGGDPLALLIGALGAGGILWGSWKALRAERLKLLVAYSTVAQIGLIALVFALAGQDGAATAWQGAIYLMVAHAVAKAAMFLSVGRIAEQLGHDRISGLNRSLLRPGPAEFAFAIAAVSLIGLPPSAGFVGKWLLIEGMVASDAWVLAALVIVSTALSAAYLSRVVSRCLRGGPHVSAEARPPEWRIGDAVALGLAACALLLGLASAMPLALLEIGAPIPLASADLPADHTTALLTER